MINPRHFLVIALLLAATSAISGYFVGERRGITKGAQAGARLAVSNLDSEMLFLMSLEGYLSEGEPDIEEIKESMINKIEAYPFSMALFSVPPFNQTGGLSFERETLEDMIGRLKDPNNVAAQGDDAN